MLPVGRRRGSGLPLRGAPRGPGTGSQRPRSAELTRWSRGSAHPAPLSPVPRARCRSSDPGPPTGRMSSVRQSFAPNAFVCSARSQRRRWAVQRHDLFVGARALAGALSTLAISRVSLHPRQVASIDGLLTGGNVLATTSVGVPSCDYGAVSEPGRVARQPAKLRKKSLRLGQANCAHRRACCRCTQVRPALGGASASQNLAAESS